jgi:hypothetical protein
MVFLEKVIGAQLMKNPKVHYRVHNRPLFLEQVVQRVTITWPTGGKVGGY